MGIQGTDTSGMSRASPARANGSSQCTPGASEPGVVRGVPDRQVHHDISIRMMSLCGRAGVPADAGELEALPER